jgi:hypothetical protein
MLKIQKFNVQIELTEPMLGTVPKDPNIYTQYIASKAPSEFLACEEIDLEKTREDLEKTGYTGFHKDEKGLFLYDYQVMGFIKEAGNTLKDQLKIKNLRSKLNMFVYVAPRRIHFAKEPSEPLERPLRAMTMQGPRVTLAKSDTVPAGTKLSFQIELFEHKEIDAKVLRTLLEFGRFNGLGQFRTGGYGRFKVLRFEPAA